MPTAQNPSPAPGSVQDTPSGTALATATLRALAAHDDRQDIRGADCLAEIFLPEDQRAPLKDPQARLWVMQNKIAPGAYEFMLARTAYFDQIVETALQQNLPQLVFLGAGYDSRPYRFRDEAANTRIFELDAAPTQARKQEILAHAAVPLPAHLVYIPIDFNQDDLSRALLAAGFSSQERALFVWEGVSYYLSAAAVDSTLAAVRHISAIQSSICFDFASLSPQALNDERFKKLRQQMQTSNPAEPARFGIPQGALEGFLAARGYRVLEHLTASEAESRYLLLRDGTSIGKPTSLFNFVHAGIVKDPA